MEMYYEVSGKGDPLIVLHGAYMNIPSMGEIIPMLARMHRIYALELQGHGRTTDIDRPITYPNLAARNPASAKGGSARCRIRCI
jgi:pimeloyl-ACP methyl ester carboxylesterase